MIDWEDLTYFGKGLVVGFFAWIFLILIIFLQRLYLGLTLFNLGPQIFYLFDKNGISLFGLVVVGVFLVFSMGLLGLIAGEVIGE